MTPAFTPRSGLADYDPVQWTAEQRAQWIELYRERREAVLPVPLHGPEDNCALCNVIHELVREAEGGKSA